MRSLPLRRFLLVLLALLMLGTLLAALGQLATAPGQADMVVTAAVRITPVALNPSPVAPYPALDPAIIAALKAPAAQTPFAVLPGLQPIGVYLVNATLTPSPTSAPSPTHTYPPSATPTLTPTASHTLTPSRTATGTHTPSRTPTLTPTFTLTATPTDTSLPTLTATAPPTLTPLSTPTAPPTSAPLFPATAFPTTIPIIDPGIAAMNGLRMTPAPANILPEDCAPAGYPVQGLLTQNFHQLHSGIDIGVDSGTPVRATQSGQVIYAGWSPLGYGFLVVVQNEHYTTYYGHNSQFAVRQWQYIHKGDIVSYSGSTGNSNGPHVHYETRIDSQAVDPLTFDLRKLPTC